jgi:hypothetical protein
MSNYVKINNYAEKDDYLTGNPLKLIKGTELNSEFNAIQTAIGTKADLASPAFTGTPTAQTQDIANSSDRLATTNFVKQALAILYPVGTIYTSTASTSPLTLFGFGTWEAFGAGRVLIGNGGGFAAGTTGGSADAIVVSHSHTITDPGHFHGVPTVYGVFLNSGPDILNTSTIESRNTASSTATTGINQTNTFGSSGTNANLQPYVVVYMWKRVS